jgi:uncharacterized protein (TIGR00645 family)
VQLLRQFMSLGTVTPEREKELMWMVIIHVVFVVSSLLLALSDRIAGGEHGQAAAAPASTSNSETTNAGSH